VLRPGGCLCFAIVHPVASAGDWAADADDAAHVVENYCIPIARPRPLGDSHVTQYHRPVDDYLRALLAPGFALASCASSRPAAARPAGSRCSSTRGQ
jgi:hypothetical protein